MKRIDFALGWPAADDTDDLFIASLTRECAARSLSFTLIDESQVASLTSQIKDDRLAVGFYLDMASETFDSRDPYTRLAYAVKDAGARIVDDPDDVKSAADKSVTHFDLVRAKVPTPYTVLVRNWEPTRRLTEEERRSLGFPFILKPAQGYGQRGVRIIAKRRTLVEIAEARKIAEGDNFLLQKLIEPLDCDGTPAWFRVYHLFGEIIPCWWNPQTHHYRQVTLKDMDRYGLLPLARITAEIARITRIDWFSCEIAIERQSRAFVVIDYMNDQCAMRPQSRRPDGVPDALIEHIAERIVEKAWAYLNDRYTLTYRAIWFPRIQVKDENT